MRAFLHEWWQDANPMQRLVCRYNLFVWCTASLSIVARLFGLRWLSDGLSLVTSFVAMIFGIWLLHKTKALRQQAERTFALNRLDPMLQTIIESMDDCISYLEKELPYGRLFDLNHAETVKQSMPTTTRSLEALHYHLKRAKRLLSDLND